MINNIDQIRKLLEFRTKDDFYFMQILQRKKDHKNMTNTEVTGSNNNSRLIKAYFITSLEYFDRIMPEVKELSNVFTARASINLNRRSWYKMSLQMLKRVTDLIINGEYMKIYKAFTSVCGLYQHDNDKTWVIDIDTNDIDYIADTISVIEECMPIVGCKLKAVIPSRSGVHLITTPFNVKEFGEIFKDRLSGYEIPEIHKNNPTNIYIPF